MSLRLEWHETAPGLLYEAAGDSGRRSVIAGDGGGRMLDLIRAGEYATEQALDQQPAPRLEQPQRMAQE